MSLRFSAEIDAVCGSAIFPCSPQFADKFMHEVTGSRIAGVIPSYRVVLHVLGVIERVGPEAR